MMTDRLWPGLEIPTFKLRTEYRPFGSLRHGKFRCNSHGQLMAGRLRSPTATLKSHGLQKEVFGERPLRKNLEDSNGSGRELHLARFIAEELPLEFRFPVAALGH